MQGQGTAAAQDVRASVSNVLRYGTGERGITAASKSFSYFENLTDVRLSFGKPVVAGFRLLVNDPPEIGDSFQGLQRRFVEFNSDDVTIRAGNFSALFGRGLGLHLFERRTLAYDTWMDGVKATYHSPLINATIIGGTLNFRDSIVITRHEQYRIRGGNLEVRLSKEITIGGSLLSADGSIPQNSGEKTINVEIPELYSVVRVGSLEWFAESSRKRTNVSEDATSSIGTGVYSSLSFSGERIGFTVEYKNYSFDERDPFQRDDLTRPTRMLPIQNPPIVHKEHTYTLLTRALHQVDFNDEVGYQAEAFLAVDASTMINLNVSRASRHNSYRLNPATFVFTKLERSANWLPSLEDSHSPFWEMFVEVEHEFTEQSMLHVGAAQRSKVISNDFSGPNFNHLFRSTVVPVKFQHRLSTEYSLTLQSEHEWMYDSYNSSQPNFYNQLITVIASRSPDISLGLRYEFTTNRSDPSGRRDWIVGEFGYHLGQSHAITLAVGRERGGQVCSNGVCTYMRPFLGVRISVQSQL